MGVVSRESLATAIDTAVASHGGFAEQQELIDMASDAVARMLAGGGQASRFLVLPVSKQQPLVEEALTSIAARIPELMALRRSKLEEQDIDALLHVLMPDPPADAARQAIVVDNAALRARFLDSFPCLSSKHVADRSGHQARNRSATASRWKREGKLFSVSRFGEDVYPEFQLQDGIPHPTIRPVLAALSPQRTSWQIAFWFVSGNSWLDGAPPIDRLGDRDSVVRAAGREVEAAIW